MPSLRVRVVVGCLALVGAVALLAVACRSVSADAFADRGWALTGGFGLLAFALTALRTGTVAVGFTLLFTVLGGLSAVTAADQPPPGAAPVLRNLVLFGLAQSIESTPIGDGGEAFAYAARVTVLAGLTACLAAAVVRVWLSSHASAPTWSADGLTVERIGRLLTVLGLIGYALALARFAISGRDAPTLFDQLKSFWTGGSYLLLLAGFSVPGIGLWLSAALERRSRGSAISCAGLAALLTLASIPTGQRGFAIQLTLVAGAVLFVRGTLSRRAVAVLVLVGISALGVTQTLRNAIREEGTVQIGSVVERLGPDRWQSLFGSQIASFRWTWDLARYRDQLDLPGPVRSLTSKPIPRAFNPGKTQGFGTDFTAEVYPEAAAEDVGFATPLVAEVDYAYHWPGVLVAFAALGGLATFLWERAIRAPALLRAVLATAVGWSAFLFVRGDLANAAVVASGWILPVAALLLIMRGRSDRLRSLLRAPLPRVPT